MPGGKRRKPRLALAANADRADDGAVGENAADAGGAFEAGIGEQLAHHEGAGLLRPEILGDGRADPELAPNTHAQTTATRSNIGNSTLGHAERC